MTVPPRRPGRRTVLRSLLGGGALALGGCGFRPLYMPVGEQGNVASKELAAVWIPVLGERTGVMMRQALQRRFEGSESGVAKQYQLDVNPSFSVEGLGIQHDNSTTRYRIAGNTSWTLRMLNLERTQLANGSARAMDGVNILNQQFFQMDLEFDVVFKRLSELMADQIAIDVGFFFKRRAQKSA